MARNILGKGSNLLVGLLLLLLVAGLAGFGVQNFGGGLRFIGKVGDRDIPVATYANALRSELAAFSQQIGQTVPFATAQALGIDRQVRAQVVTMAALDNETARLGISVGDAHVRATLLGIPQFRGPTDQFDREIYRNTLRQNGLTEATFETQVREETARTLLQGALLGGVRAPESAVEAVFAHQVERRGFTHAVLEASALSPPVGTPDDATLEAWYAANPAPFTTPEAKRITYAWLLPSMLAGKMSVDEKLLREGYEARKAEYAVPEKRLVERLGFATEAEAAAARAQIDQGITTFDALVTARGLAIDDVDLGDQSLEELGEAGPGVFALTEPGIAGPLPSPLGPALFRMNAILPAQTTTYDEARPTLVMEQTLDAARREIEGQITDLDDRLAGGATLEDLARETDMEIGTLDYFAGVESDLAGYPDFRKAAEAVAEEDFPQIVQLDDGGLVALRLDAVVPPALKPLADVRDEAIAGWQAAETRKRLLARGEEIRAAMVAGSSFESETLTPETIAPVTRDAFVEGAPPEVIAAAFAMKPDDVRLVETPEDIHLVRLGEVVAVAPDTGDPALTARRDEIAAQMSQSVAQDIFTLYARALEAEAGIRLDESAISAVHAQFP